MSESSVNLRFFLIVLIVLALIGAAGYRIMEKVYLAQMRNQASVVADNVQSFGQWVADYGRVWVYTDQQASFLRSKQIIKVAEFPNLAHLPDDQLKPHVTT